MDLNNLDLNEKLRSDNFNCIKNIVVGAVMFAACLTAFFGIGRITSGINYAGREDEIFTGTVIWFVRSAVLMISVLGGFTAVQNVYKLYAFKTGIELHSTGLIVFEIIGAIISMLIKTLFFTPFIVIGLLTTAPALAGLDEAAASDSAWYLGFVFIAAGAAAVAGGAVKAVREIKNAFVSYSFDRYAMTGDTPEEPAAEETENN